MLGIGQEEQKKKKKKKGRNKIERDEVKEKKLSNKNNTVAKTGVNIIIRQISRRPSYTAPRAHTPETSRRTDGHKDKTPERELLSPTLGCETQSAENFKKSHCTETGTARRPCMSIYYVI